MKTTRTHQQDQRRNSCRSILTLILLVPALTGFSQPHWVPVGDLPRPTAQERLEVFDTATRTWFSFPTYDSGDLNLVFSSPHGSNGVFSWTQTTSFNNYRTYWGRGVSDGTNLYFNGTIEDSNFSRSSFAPILGDGQLGTWQMATPLPVPDGGRGRSLHQTFIFDGRLYVIGGWHGDGLPAYRDAYYATIQGNGAPGSFVQTTSLPDDTNGWYSALSATVSTQGVVYVADLYNLWKGQILPAGAITNWVKQPIIPGMRHLNGGNTGIALLGNRLVVVD